MFEFSHIFIGAIVAAALIVWRHANLAAHKQKAAAIRLKSYLRYWQERMLKSGFSSSMGSGVRAGDFAEFDEKAKDEFFSKIKEVVNLKSAAIKADMVSSMKMPDLTSDNFILQTNSNLQNLIEGKMFVSDEEASSLDVDSAGICIELKMNLAELLVLILSFHLKIREVGENFEIKGHNDLANFYWTILLVSNNINALSQRVEPYLEKSIPRLTCEEMFPLPVVDGLWKILGCLSPLKSAHQTNNRSNTRS